MTTRRKSSKKSLPPLMYLIKNKSIICKTTDVKRLTDIGNELKARVSIPKGYTITIESRQASDPWLKYLRYQLRHGKKYIMSAPCTENGLKRCLDHIQKLELEDRDYAQTIRRHLGRAPDVSPEKLFDIWTKYEKHQQDLQDEQHKQRKQHKHQHKHQHKQQKAIDDILLDDDDMELMENIEDIFA